MIRPSWTLFCALLFVLYHLGNFFLPINRRSLGELPVQVYLPRLTLKRGPTGKLLPHLDLDELNLSVRRLHSSTRLREIGNSVQAWFGQLPEWVFLQHKKGTTLFLQSDLGVSQGTTPFYQQSVQSAVQSISDLSAKLKNEHWKLLVVPVPSKVSIRRDSITWPVLELDKLSRIPIQQDRADEVCDLLFAGLKNAGVEFIDLRPDFRRETDRDPQQTAIFPAAESHWTGLGIQIAADRVTARLHALYGLEVDGSNVKMEKVAYYCDLARALDLSPIVPTPLSGILEINDRVPFNHKAAKEQPRSFLALAGTSYSGQYSWYPKAGFAQTLDGMLPSTRVVSFAEAGHGSLRTMMTFLSKRSEIYSQLASYPDHLIRPDDKYLIWEFPIRDLGSFVGTVFAFSPENDDPASGADPVAVECQNGLEMAHEKSFFWLNSTPATLRFRGDNRERFLSLSWITYRGANLAGESTPRVEFTIEGHRQVIQITEGVRDTVTNPVPEHIERVTLRCVNPVASNPPPANNAEKRTLMLGVSDLRAKFDDQPVF
jgi:hypothetical protein